MLAAVTKREQLCSIGIAVEQPDNLLRHLPCFVPGHGNAHFSIATDGGEVNMIPAQFRDRSIKESAHTPHSFRHIFLPFPPKGKGETAQRAGATQLTCLVNSVIISVPTPEASEAA